MGKIERVEKGRGGEREYLESGKFCGFSGHVNATTINDKETQLIQHPSTLACTVS